MSTIGLIGLLVGFFATALSVMALLAGHLLGGTASKRTADGRVQGGAAENLTYGGRVAMVLAFICLTVCCAVLVICFMTGNMQIQYVLNEHSNDTSGFAWLYRLAGLWAGREGSLLFWAWLISLFGTIVALRRIDQMHTRDNIAVLVIALVLVAFTGVLLFSDTNMPFTVTSDTYLEDGKISSSAVQMLGMNSLLEHWAMAIHPPMLFAGYAGLTVPFAYAIAALVTNDSSDAWVRCSTRYALVSWLFLTVGIGLGAVWAYVCLGWGGYWGWDPVENASLLPWLVGVALLHSFTVYRKRGTFKRWSIMCACITFSFVILGTFITRSGLVQSVHAFAGDTVSLVLFLALIILSVVAGVVGLIIRWKHFGSDVAADEQIESMLSRDIAYYLNNLVLIVLACLLAYMTISQALPSWMPFGGSTVSSGTYNAIARPIGIIYLAILACCPLLGWGKTDGKAFLKKAIVPGILAVLVFAALMYYWATTLLPAYNEAIAAGGSIAEGFTVYGPAAYYHGLAIVGFLVASLLFFNALLMIGRGIGRFSKAKHINQVQAVFSFARNVSSQFGGGLVHAGLAICLVGLIGSSMYVSETAGYVQYNEDEDTAEAFTASGYELDYTANSAYMTGNYTAVMYQVEFDLKQGDATIGHLTPALKLIANTQQTQAVAAVHTLPLEDVFVIYNGVDDDGNFSIDVYINRLILFVWIGFGVMIAGALIAALGKGRGKLAEVAAVETVETARATEAAQPIQTPAANKAPQSQED